jgi:O-acetyl-ADP-ribose deacetylase (regulator of RNase III)
MLRRRGAQVHDGKYEDTIQRELDWQLRDRGRPVQAAEVFATSAGGPGSELAKINKARYIFHVASVQAVDAQGTVIPYKEPYQVGACVRASLSKLLEINQLQGVISPPGTEPRTEQEKLAALGLGAARSILFPLFGTGQGGSAAAEVIEPMLEGITEFLGDTDYLERLADLTDIYISAFKQEDVDVVIEFLRKRFG